MKLLSSWKLEWYAKHFININYARIGVYTDRIYDVIFIRENTSQWKSVFPHALLDKTMSGKIFVNCEKFRHFCPTQNFVHFQNLKLTQKRLKSFIFLEIYPFFIKRTTATIKKFYFSTILLNLISLPSIKSGFLFTFGLITSLWSSSTSSPSESWICSVFLFFFVLTASISSSTPIMISIFSSSWTSVSSSFLASKSKE